MNRKVTQILLMIFGAMLAAELIFVGIMHIQKNRDASETQPATEPTAEITEAPTEEETQAPTETDPPETEPPETEPQEQRYTLTFAGDCTLGSTASKWNSSYSFIQTIGEDYDFPFAKVAEYFESDDFTMVNLEGPLTETGTAAQKQFAFKGPTAYTQILTGSSVEAVTLANNHSEDYGTEGYESTTKVLGEAGVAYVEKNKTTLVTTESGLKIGLYAAAFEFNYNSIKTNIAQLRADGAVIVIAAFHWGTEGSYRPTSSQQSFGRAAIDAGADIVFGHHPHVLQKIEQYGDGYIFYSLGNFSFGGSSSPQDYDTAILQMEVIRDVEGNVSLGELTIIPCSASSASGYNNYQPIPLEEGTTAYDRVLSKLDGSFTGADLVVDYNKNSTSETTAATTPAATAPAEVTPAETAAPATPDSSSSESGGDSAGESGGDSGSDILEPDPDTI